VSKRFSVKVAQPEPEKVTPVVPDRIPVTVRCGRCGVIALYGVRVNSSTGKVDVYFCQSESCDYETRIPVA